MTIFFWLFQLNRELKSVKISRFYQKIKKSYLFSNCYQAFVFEYYCAIRHTGEMIADATF